MRCLYSCDLKTLGDMVSDDLEFYHDQTGLARGRQAFLDAVKTNICGITHRELIPRRWKFIRSRPMAR